MRSIDTSGGPFAGCSSTRYVWPKSVRASIQDVALDMYESAATMKEVSRKGATYADWTASDGSLMAAASKVRLLLDLPPRNSGC